MSAVRRVLPAVLACAAAVASLCATTGARAAELAWPGKPFQMVVNEKKLGDFLREFSASQGTTAVVDPKIEGTISGRFSIARDPTAARKILDDICASYGLTWYYDGSLLFIEPASEARDEMIPISPDAAGKVQAALQRMRVGDRRLMLVVNAAEGQVMVSGPRRYVESVRQIVRNVDTRANLRDRSEVRVFPLKYAWANDFQIRRSAGASASVPGVVSVLRSLFDPRYVAGRGSSPSNGMAISMPRVSGNRQVAMPSGSVISAPRLDVPGGMTPTTSDDAQSPAVTAASRGELPQFQADSRMNAVLVRDLPERMGEYARLIASMDTRPKLIEIEVTIMDVSYDSLERLGVDWRAHTSRVDAQIGNGAYTGLAPGSASVAGTTYPFTPLGGVLTVSIGNELRNFLLARVSALATTGDASFVARPKVVTLDNTEAALENKSEFFVRVSGFQDSSLYTVVAGTDVRVTPLIVDDPAGRAVMLNINIGDDSLSTDTVDNLPVVRRRGVVTQAMVEEGKSLLLAGYSSEERFNGATGVPLLSSIPVLGNLFKYREDRRNNAERLYLLTPRYVTPEAVVNPAAPAARAKPPTQDAPVVPTTYVRPRLPGAGGGPGGPQTRWMP